MGAQLLQRPSSDAQFLEALSSEAQSFEQVATSEAQSLVEVASTHHRGDVR